MSTLLRTKIHLENLYPRVQDTASHLNELLLKSRSGVF